MIMCSKKVIERTLGTKRRKKWKWLLVSEKLYVRVGWVVESVDCFLQFILHCVLAKCPISITQRCLDFSNFPSLYTRGPCWLQLSCSLLSWQVLPSYILRSSMFYLGGIYLPSVLGV